MISVHLDAVGGVAGDMFVAAMLDARPDLRERVMADAAAILPAEAGTAVLAETMNGGLRALRFGLEAAGHVHHHHHDSGSFRDMVARIRVASLQPGTADQAVGILTLIAEAEAAIHRIAVEEVHFHEIADWDSLLDVVAAGSIAAALQGARWTVSPLPRGGGLVKTQHGWLPVPAPATAMLLAGFQWRDDGIEGERVTPTGAAILRHLIPPDRPADAAGRLTASGSGAGTRTLPGLPNILRALVFEATDHAPGDWVAVLEFDIDDMTGEEIAVAADRLRAVEGVLDVSIGLRSGKKGRPMHDFRLLVRPEASQDVALHCFAETSTIGLRWREDHRLVLPRQLARIERAGATIGVKTVQRPGGETVKAESDDLAGEDLAARRRLKALAEDGEAP